MTVERTSSGTYVVFLAGMWFKLLLFELLLFLTHSLHCFPQDPLAGRSIFSGNLFQYLEENRKWRSRFVSVPNSYTINLYENKTVRWFVEFHITSDHKQHINNPNKP